MKLIFPIKTQKKLSRPIHDINLIALSSGGKTEKISYYPKQEGAKKYDFSKEPKRKQLY